MIIMFKAARDRLVDACIGWLSRGVRGADEHTEYLGIGGAAPTHFGWGDSDVRD